MGPGVKSVSVAEAICHADNLEISCHSITRVQLPALESLERKRHTSYWSYSMNVCVQNYWSTAPEVLGKTARTLIILSPETPWTLYNYLYLDDNIAYGAKCSWYNGTKLETKKHIRHGTQCVIQYPTNRNKAQSL